MNSLVIIFLRAGFIADVKALNIHQNFDFFFASSAAASFFWLGPKETKAQGLDPMSDKFVKA